MLEIAIDGGDATELADMLQFLADWLAADHDHLDTSLTRYVGNPAYGADRLQTGLHRFIFLLRGDDGGQLFGDHPGPGAVNAPAAIHSSRLVRSVVAEHVWSAALA